MIRLDELSVRAGAFGLDQVSLEVPAGGYAVLMGRTGSGKTTLLEAVCGLRASDGGRVWLGGRDVTGLPPGQRGVGFVPQDGVLFPTMTVAENLGFALDVAGWPRDEQRRRVAELAALLDITALLPRRPRGLSGGEAQRVALGRALAPRPAVLCLDEPLSALDEATRDQMCALLRLVQRQTGVTTLHVTHSGSEARRLADQLFVIDGGRLVTAPAAARAARGATP